MIKNPNRFWIAVFLLGWAFDFLFWGHEPGISFAIFVALTLLTGYFLLRSENLFPSKWTLVLLAPIVFYAIMTFMRTEPLTVLTSHAMALLLMAVFVVTYIGGRWIQYSLTDYVVRAFQLVVSVIASPLMLVFGNKKPQADPQAEGEEASSVKPEKASRHIWPVVRGILIAIPIIAVFSALLSSADLVFAQRLNSVIQLFRLEKLPEYIFRGVYIAALGYMLMGVLIHAAEKSADDKLYGLDKPLIPPFLGFTEAAVVLGAVVALFAFFVVIQFQYFFGGQANITVEGYTFAEYARRGFGELVAVAFFSLLLFLGLSAITRRETVAQRRIFSYLGVALVVLVFIMLLSAYYRLVLYEQAYGFTRQRAYTHIFMIWLAMLLAVTVVLDLLQRQRSFAFAAMLALIGFTVSLALVNVDEFIVNHNVDRVQSGFDLDVGYLASLSADAVPALADHYTDESLPQTTRDMVGASLACINAQNSFGDFDAWQSFNYSAWKAGEIFQSLDLSGYTIVDENAYPLTVISEQNPDTEYQCSGYYSD